MVTKFGLFAPWFLVYPDFGPSSNSALVESAVPRLGRLASQLAISAHSSCPCRCCLTTGLFMSRDTLGLRGVLGALAENEIKAEGVAEWERGLTASNGEQRPQRVVGIMERVALTSFSSNFCFWSRSSSSARASMLPPIASRRSFKVPAAEASCPGDCSCRGLRARLSGVTTGWFAAVEGNLLGAGNLWSTLVSRHVISMVKLAMRPLR